MKSGESFWQNLGYPPLSLGCLDLLMQSWDIFFALFRSPASLLTNLVFATINYLYHFHTYKCFRLKRPKDSKIIVIIFTISTAYTSIILLHAFIPVSISFIFLPEKWENCNIHRVSQENSVFSSCYRLWKNYFFWTLSSCIKKRYFSLSLDLHLQKSWIVSLLSSYKQTKKTFATVLW